MSRLSAYNQEQLDTIGLIWNYLSSQPDATIRSLREKVFDYLVFRKNVGAFFERYFSSVCTQKCYQSQVSACCTKEGIITFFSDVVINLLESNATQVHAIIRKLSEPQNNHKCIYLEPTGCMWQVKPIVCEMFLCDAAKQQVFALDPDVEPQWQAFKEQEKLYKWPDKPVVFDEIEELFLQAGLSSPLMYFHNSPGLLRIKQMSRSRSK